MAGKPNPVVFQNECNEIPLSEENEEAAEMRQQQRYQDAYRKGVNERLQIGQPRYNLRSASLSTTDAPGASVGCDEGVRKQVPTTRRTQAQSDSIGQNTVTAARELPLTVPLVDFDSESKQEPSDRLPSDRDGVRKRPVEARSISSLTSHATGSSNPLPLSSSEVAEEQGHRSKPAQDRLKKGSGRPQQKRNRSD